MNGKIAFFLSASDTENYAEQQSSLIRLSTLSHLSNKVTELSATT